MINKVGNLLRHHKIAELLFGFFLAVLLVIFYNSRKIDAEKRNSGWNRLGNLFHSEVDRKKMYEVHQQNPLTASGKVIQVVTDHAHHTKEFAEKTVGGMARTAGR